VTLSALLHVYAALAGMMVGSYLNVLIHRVPIGRSTVLPRSACPWCGGPIRARDNIPLLSYLILRGRCRRCSAPISWRYPMIEAFTGFLFVLCLRRFGPSTDAVVAAVFSSLMVVLAGIDRDHFLLPDKITLPGIVAGLALQPWFDGPSFLEALMGVMVGAGLLILLVNFWYWLRGEEGMGLGDVNMLAMIGAFLGWKGVLVTLVVATLTGAVVGIALMVGGRLGMRSKLPFGVFLALGALVTLFAGDWLVALYAGTL
jgi:leader peptidase (prepilin peptidase)/N-methyltransferase